MNRDKASHFKKGLVVELEADFNKVVA